MAATSKQQKKLNPKQVPKSRKRSLVDEGTVKRAKKKVQRTPKVTENGQKSSLKELNASKRQNWVALNKNQNDFLSSALNAAVSFAMSMTDTDSAVKFEQQNSFLNATQSILIQSVGKVKVPPTKQSMSKTNSISKAKFIEISKNMDSTIDSLTEAIHKEKKLLQEREQLFRNK